MRKIPNLILLTTGLAGVTSGEPLVVDFAYAPPEWQTSICLPDDPHKTLVDKGGELLYHYYKKGGQSHHFDLRIGVEVVPDAAWVRQEVVAPDLPVVRTIQEAPGLEIVQEAFAVWPEDPGSAVPRLRLERTDRGHTLRNWAQPDPGLTPALRDIHVHNEGTIEYVLSDGGGEPVKVALALCEGWWDKPSQRVQVLEVEGAPPVTVDTVADLGRNRAGAFWFDAHDTDGNGIISIRVRPAENAGDRSTILNALWIFPSSLKPDDQALLTGALDGRALARHTDADASRHSRNDLILVRLTNTGDAPRTLSPRLTINTGLKVTPNLDARRVDLSDGAALTSSLEMKKGHLEDGTRHAVTLEALTIPPGETRSFTVLHAAGAPLSLEPRTLAGAEEARAAAERHWRASSVPRGHIEVPDPDIQALVTSSIRNIWQAREIKKGLPAFQVGPTCYRGLWIVDGAFLLEAAAILGAGDQARAGVAYELTFQKEDGRIEVMGPKTRFTKENGIVLWTCARHARLTRDKAWLESVWPRLGRIAEHIKTLRAETLTNDTPLDDGLIPPGFTDGGIGGLIPEYSNTYWNLAGLRAFIDAARWLGRDDEAAAWQAELDDFLAAFRRAAERDMKTDPHGHRYLPTRMDGKDTPQRGQWAFCHAVYPGQVFPRDDALVTGNLAMLGETLRERMVFGTGWDEDGIWNYFASFYGHALLWQGEGGKAAAQLYAMANHAAPTLVWREEQSLRGDPFRKVGDMPHNWASAEFIRLTTHLLALDRGDELHLLQGLPTAWTRPGMRTALNGVATPFGPLTMELVVHANGTSATLKVEPLVGECLAIIVHKPEGGRQTLAPDQRHEIRLNLRPPAANLRTDL